MKKIAIIGAGISGLSAAQILNKHFEVVVFEKENTPGGLVRCKRHQGYLFHLTGGHVFNSKNKQVLDWFWSFFNREQEFVKTPRNAVISMHGNLIGYPIENHIYMMSPSDSRKIIRELLHLYAKNTSVISNFEDFLKNRFGETLYKCYFHPYNKKIWRQELNQVPLSWLEGKLPMPTVEEILLNNIYHAKEENMVHSSFYYAKSNGSQFIADRLANGLKIRFNTTVTSFQRDGGHWLINGETFDYVVFCGNLKQLPNCLVGIDLGRFEHSIEQLQYHGTTSVLCNIQSNPYSWIYLPDETHLSHRIICTGNFSPSNNPTGTESGIVEFTDLISEEEILENLKKIPFSPKYISHHYAPYTYPIQSNETRDMILRLKKKLQQESFFLLGRFADWEYYNMDAAIAAAMETSQIIIQI